MSNINWEQRRYEMAKAMLPAVYIEDGNESRVPRLSFRHKTTGECCREAIRFADTLIKELKKNEQYD